MPTSGSTTLEFELIDDADKFRRFRLELLQRDADDRDRVAVAEVDDHRIAEGRRAGQDIGGAGECDPVHAAEEHEAIFVAEVEDDVVAAVAGKEEGVAFGTADQ